MVKPTGKSGARYDMVMTQIMEAAEQLFAQRGVAGTSLQELAEAVGLTRTGIYHYVSGKDELLGALVRGFTLETAEALEQLAGAATPGAAERLRRAVEIMAEKVARHPQRFRLLLTSEEAFPEELAVQHRAARRSTLSSLTALVRQAITEGTCRSVDPELAAFALAGVANWTAFWYPPRERRDALTPDGVAREMAAIALGGLLTINETVPSDPTSAVLQKLKDDVARLEILLRDDDGKTLRA